MEQKNTIERQCGLQTNALYLLSLAMDLILRNNEWMMSKRREAFKKEKKQLFTRFSKAVKTACILQDQLTSDIWEVEQNYNYQNVDVWLDEANELARLILLFADKSIDQDVVDKIFKFIREQPGEGIVDEKLLENFYLK
jgi:vesicle coat complex subunit